MYLPRDVRTITVDTLNSLIANQVPEGKMLDYKEMFTVGTNDEKKEFLADVTSFANTVGGHLVFGIREQQLLPTEIIGIQNIDPDQEILRLLNLLRTSVEPRIPGLEIHAVEINPNIYVLVVYIPRSWAQPHAVTHGGPMRFYARHSAGKYPLNVDEVRSAFQQTGLLIDQIRRFRLEQIAKIQVGDNALPILKRGNEVRACIIHVIPLNTFETPSIIEPYLLDGDRVVSSTLSPLKIGHSNGYTFDGFLTYNPEPRARIGEGYPGYLQVFRNGTCEVVDTVLLGGGDDGFIIPSPAFEVHTANKLEKIFQFYRYKEIPAPFAVFFSLIGVRRMRCEAGNHLFGVLEQGQGITQNDLLFPEIIIDDVNLSTSDIAIRLRTVYDRLWNASGMALSPHFHLEGNTWRFTGRL